MSLNFKIDLNPDSYEKSEHEDYGVYESSKTYRYAYVFEDEIFSGRDKVPGFYYAEDITPDQNAAAYTYLIQQWLTDTIQYKLMSPEKRKRIPGLAMKVAQMTVRMYIMQSRLSRNEFDPSLREYRFSIAATFPLVEENHIRIASLASKQVDISKCTYRPNK